MSNDNQISPQMAAAFAIMQGMGSNKQGRVQQGDLNPIFDLYMGGLMGNQFGPEVDDEAILRQYAPQIVAIESSVGTEENAMIKQVLKWIKQGKIPTEIGPLISKGLSELKQSNDPKDVEKYEKLASTLYSEWNASGNAANEARTKRKANDPYTKQGLPSPDDYTRVRPEETGAALAPYLAKLQQAYAPYKNPEPVVSPDKQAASQYGGVPKGLMGLYAPLLDWLRKKPAPVDATDAAVTKPLIEQAHDRMLLANQANQLGSYGARRTNLSTETLRKPGTYRGNMTPAQALTEYAMSKAQSNPQQTDYTNPITQERDRQQQLEMQSVAEAAARRVARTQTQENAQQAQQTSSSEMMKKIVLMKIMSNPSLLQNPNIQKLLNPGG